MNKEVNVDNSQMQCQVFLSDCTDSESIPAKEAFVDMRRRPKLHGDFCSRLLKCVVGTHKWKMNHLKVPVQDFVTVSDEAFALLVIINNHERWMETWKRKEEDGTTVEAVNLVQPEFTNGGENLKNGCTRKHCGWSAEGIQLFNDLRAEVGASRPHGKSLMTNCCTSGSRTGRVNEKGAVSRKKAKRVRH